jgi:membrane protease YdiL (CAAX protease family)
MNGVEAKSTHETIASATNRPDWPLVLFFVLAYAIAWGIFGLMGLIAQRSGVDSAQALMRMGESLQFEGASLIVPEWAAYLLTRLADFAFSIAGVFMIAAIYGRAGLADLGRRLLRWRVGWRWWMVALLPFALYGLATVVSGNLGGFTFTPATLGTILFNAEVGFLVYFFLRGAMGEELGLRGFALPRLQARMSPFWASAIIGILWAGWHLPVLLGRDIVSIVVFQLLAFVLSFIFTWLFNGSGGSLLPVMIFHAAQNSEEIFETLFPGLVGIDWELISSVGLLLLGLVVSVILWRQRQRKLSLLADFP